ncbi:MAG: aminoglycoside/hydroxyurea antibiotic resistance kinase [Chthonomonadaceae bacterium]|nr:aminoglycoside/hydroxyurea antibiotic resistance kinase [Chthonomonadaceae bacterium]
MNVFIPAFLQQHILEFGAEGAQWLAHLPLRIAELEQAWGFRVGPAFDHGGAVSWVAPVELEDGSEAVLKIGIPHDEARFESQALRFLEGRGAVRLLQASEDGFALLLERCVPGTDLWSLDEEEGNAVACRILARMWREPELGAPFISLSDSVAKWWDDLPHNTTAAACEGEVVAEAVARGRELAASQPQSVLLHGDFHPGNVLAAQREPWLFIDPKPLVGEPAYDLAQWLYNRSRFVMQSDNAVAILRQQIDRFATDLGLDPARIAGWAFVKALGWECGPEVFTLFQKVAQSW